MGRGNIVMGLKVRRRELLARSPLGPMILDRYPYAFTPRQLHVLVSALDDVDGVDGVCVEVGCWQGATTVFLQRHLEDVGTVRPYHCIDTFGGFVPADIDVERTRGKASVYDDFDYNSKRLFELTLKANGVLAGTVVHQADAAAFDYASLPPVAFALIDVDLYRPMSAALAGVWARLQPGGVIVVDDCDPTTDKWDGAAAAYQELCQEHGLTPEVRERKLGILRRPIGG